MREIGQGAVGVLLSVILFGIAGSALAGSKSQFKISPGKLSDTLVQIGLGTGAEVLYDPMVVAGKRSPAITGQLSVEDAVKEALVGTGLKYGVRASGVIVISRCDEPSAAPVAPAVTRPKPSAPPVDDNPLEVIVFGIRAGTQSAQIAKRNAAQISDSVFAEDIDKLPDGNTAEALQRLSGVQIIRFQASGVGVQVRGISQILAELNGRPIFSAGINNEGTPTRTLNFEDLPAELIAKAELIKSPSADQVEGGIGGTVNFTTQRPLSLKKQTFGISVRDIYSEGLPVQTPSASVFFVDHWDSSIGPIGIWASYSTERHAYRVDQEIGTAPSLLVPVTLPGGVSQDVGASFQDFAYYEYGIRLRDNFNLSAEWRPRSDLNISLGFNRSINTNLDNVEDTVSRLGLTQDPVSSAYTITPVGSPSIAKTRDGTPYIQSASVLSDAYFNAFAGRKRGATTQVAVAAVHKGETWTSSFDAYYVTSEFDSLFNEVDSEMWNINLNYDFSGKIGRLNYPNTNLSDLSKYTVTEVNFAHQHDFGTDSAIRLDFDRAVSGFVTHVKFGLRLSDRRTSFWGNNPVFPLNVPATDVASLYRPTRYSNLLGGGAGNGLQRWMVPNTSMLIDISKTFSMFGISSIPGPDPRQAFAIEELGTAGYLKLDFATSLGAWPVDGNVGVRVVGTNMRTIGPNLDFATGVVAGTVKKQINDTKVLPSVNLRLKFDPQWQLRLAASRAVARPEFNLLNPTLFIVYNFQSASGGDPGLKPLTADQADASLEYYFAKQGFLTADLFYKSVLNFPERFTRPEIIAGKSYQVTLPQNAPRGWVNGAEFSYQQFFDGLPRPYNGLGVNANVTIIDSKAPDGAGGVGRLPSMSRLAYNLILMYEQHRTSFRIAYNWRGNYPLSYADLSGRRYANMQSAYGQLDAGLDYRLTPHLTLSLDAANMTNAMSYQAFAGVDNSALRTERRWTVGFRYRN